MRGTGRAGGLVLAVAVGTAVLTGCDRGADAVTAERPLLVAAAADLRPAFTELGASFEDATGEEVVFTFGSSGQLAQQLLEGAPMDLFASANAAYVDRVIDGGVGDAATQRTYAFGRLVLWSRADASSRWEDLDALAADGGPTNLAIANPDHAPYGQAAAEALRTAGILDQVRSKLVYGENVADTQRLAATGNADAAIIALSLAVAADEAGEGRWTLLDDRLHEPLQQVLVVTATDPDRASLAGRFIDHVSSDAGRGVMRRFGFLGEGEDPPATWER
ncbi:MAG: molybdate ABC transporter substrate-binding protein [Nitriliruptoraceae bacterium]